MTDNKTLPFTGDGDATSTVATDEIGGVDYQRIKMTLGADGVNDGDVSDENPIPAKTAIVAHPRLLRVCLDDRSWRGICVTPSGNVYAAELGGDIYMQTAETGPFTALGGASRNWHGMCAALNGDVYASEASGDIYVQTGGAGAFVALGGTSRAWRGMCAAPNGDIYAVVSAGDIYKRSGGSGAFVAMSQTSRDWYGICADPNGEIYATTETGYIYRLSSGTFSLVTSSPTAAYGICSNQTGDFLYYVQAGSGGTSKSIRILNVFQILNPSDGIEAGIDQPNAEYKYLALSVTGNLYATSAPNSAYPVGIFRMAVGPLRTDGGLIQAKANRNGAGAAYLEDRHTGVGARVSEAGALVVDGGRVPHDSPADGSIFWYPKVNPTLGGGYASAAAPTDVSADGDAVRSWHLRNGAQATVLTAAGALIGGDATNGLDVDVTRVPTDPFGANADAAVVTDASGSISAKIRGLVKLLAEKISVYLSPSTSGGLSSFAASAAPSGTILQNTPRAVKSGAGQLYGWYIYNPESAVSFVHFWDAAVGSVTVGSTAPKFTLPIPAGGAANVLGPHGIPFATAITVAATTTAGGSTSPATGVTLTAFYF